MQSYQDSIIVRYEITAKSQKDAIARGEKFYIGTPCKKAGHTLKFRSGHCCTCERYRQNTKGSSKINPPNEYATKVGRLKDEIELRKLENFALQEKD